MTGVSNFRHFLLKAITLKPFGAVRETIGDYGSDSVC